MKKRLYTLVLFFLVCSCSWTYAQMYEGSMEVLRSTNGVVNKTDRSGMSVSNNRSYGRQDNAMPSAATPYNPFTSNQIAAGSSVTGRQRVSEPTRLGNYHSKVYEPFTDINGNHSGPRKIIIPDDPDRDDESPIGGPLVLLLFAFAAGLLKFRRRSSNKE